MKWRIPIPDVVLKALGLLLIVAAVLKGHELLTVPVAGNDLWSWRPFLIFQVECDLANAPAVGRGQTAAVTGKVSIRLDLLRYLTHARRAENPIS